MMMKRSVKKNAGFGRGLSQKQSRGVTFEANVCTVVARCHSPSYSDPAVSLWPLSKISWVSIRDNFINPLRIE